MLKLSSCILIFAIFLTSPAQQNPDSARIHAQIQRIEDALPKITDRGAVLFMEARFQIRLGDLNKALALVKECVAMDQGFDPGDEQDFKALDSNPEFRELVEQVHRRQPPVHRAQVAYTVQDKELFPEGLAYDPGRKVFYMGSMHRRKIVMITRAGRFPTLSNRFTTCLKSAE